MGGIFEAMYPIMLNVVKKNNETILQWHEMLIIKCHLGAKTLRVRDLGALNIQPIYIIRSPSIKDGPQAQPRQWPNVKCSFVMEHTLEHDRLYPLNVHPIYRGQMQSPNLMVNQEPMNCTPKYV